MEFNPSIPGYVFEYVPTLASGDVDLDINDSLKYTVIENVSDEAFQSLWIEIQLPQKSNIIFCIIYRQHNSPKRFQEYFDDKLERLITSKKSIYIMGDFNINLLHAEASWPVILRTSYFVCKAFHLSQLLTNQHVFTITQPP